MAEFFAGECAVVGDGLVTGDVVEAVFDEVWLLHAGQHESFFAIELLLHCDQEGVLDLGGRIGNGFICN